MIMRETRLFYHTEPPPGMEGKGLTHDKEYRLQMRGELGTDIIVEAFWGPRNHVSNSQVKYLGRSTSQAHEVFEKIEAQKKKKGYTEDERG